MLSNMPDKAPLTACFIPRKNYTVLGVSNVAWYISMSYTDWGWLVLCGISTCNWLFRHCDATFRTQVHRYECLLRH